jgi:hypothetical protein
LADQAGPGDQDAVESVITMVLDCPITLVILVITMAWNE